MNSLSELAIRIQNIKFKMDEPIIYHNNTLHMDLPNVELLQVNTVKEMAQGILFDKIYNMTDLSNIVRLMSGRESACIRPEWKYFLKYK